MNFPEGYSWDLNELERQYFTFSMKKIHLQKSLDLPLQIAEEFRIAYRVYSHLYCLQIFFPKKWAFLFCNPSVLLRR